MLDQDEIHSRIEFIRACEALKETLRSAHTSCGRAESTAEHSWRLSLWLLTFADAFPQANSERLLQLSIIHDLGEAISGDIPAPEQKTSKSKKEETDLLSLIEGFPASLRDKFHDLWKEYEAGETLESQLVKGFDKLETITQHNQGKNSTDFDYQFNLSYAKTTTDKHALIRQIRALLDTETQSKINR